MTIEPAKSTASTRIIAWCLVLFLAGLMALIIHGAVSADTSLQSIPIPFMGQTVLNPETNKLYILSEGAHSGDYVTVLNGSTYVTKALSMPSDGYVDAAVDPIHNRIYFLPLGYITLPPIRVMNGATDTWTTSLPVPASATEYDNANIAVDAQRQHVYFSEHGRSPGIRVNRLNAVTGATLGTITVTTELSTRAIDLIYNPINDKVYLLTSHYNGSDWWYNNLWVLDFTTGLIWFQEDSYVQGAKLVLNETSGDVYFGTTALDGQRLVVLTRNLPAQVRVVNPYTNKIYAFNSGGTLYEVDGESFAQRALRSFPTITTTVGADCLAINPTLNKLYLFSSSSPQTYVYDPERNSTQTLSYGMTPWALLNPLNHRLYIAPSKQQVRIFDGAPTLNATPTTLNFVAVQDGADPPAKAITIRMNSGDLGNLRYTATSDAAWLAAQTNGRFLEWYPVSTTLEAQVSVNVDITGLAARATPYVGHLTIASEGAKSSPRTVTVNLTVGDGAAPLMQVDAASPARFEAMTGGAAPAPQTVQVRNLGSGSLTYTVTETIPWLTVSGSKSGSVSAGELKTVTLTTTSAFTALAPGSYTAPITVTSTSLGSPQIVDVEALIYPQPRLDLSTLLMPFNAFVEGGNPALQYLFISNGGGGVIDWTAAKNPSWVQTSGALSGRAPGSFQVGANIASLDLGVHQGAITVTSSSPNVTNSPQVVKMPVNVDTLRRMALSTSRLEDFAFVKGTTPAAQSFKISNAGGGGAFNWQAETDATWLTLSATAGTANESGTTVQVNVNAAQLAVGEHHATITVRGDRVKGAVQTIRVAAFVASASAPSCLPGVQLDVVKTSLVKIAVDIVSIDVYHGAACEVTANVDLNVYTFNRTYRSSGSISASNQLLIHIPDTIGLTLAKVGLNLTSVQISNDALTAQGQWNFGSLLGQTKSAGQVRIGRNGISFDGSATFPINQSWSFEGFGFSARQGTVRMAQSFNDLTLEIDGELTVKVFGSRDVKLNVILEVSRQGVSAKGSLGEVPLPNFDFQLGGFTVQTREARFINGKVEIGRAEIKTPANWGGLGAEITAMTIDGSGDVTVGGGKLRLPTIKAGGLNLMSLEGELRKVTNVFDSTGLTQPAAAGYEIRAAGGFGTDGTSNSGPCSILVDVTVYVNALGATVMELAPLDPSASVDSLNPAAPDGFGLRNVTVGVHCLPGVPLGNTSFFITGVQGSITLYDRVESVSLKMWIEHITRIGPNSVVSTDPELTLHFSPFAIDFNAGLRLIGVKVSETDVHVDKNKFSTVVTFDFLIVHGYTSFSAGTQNGKGYIAGSGGVSVKIDRGKIYHTCKLFCVNIPPWNINLGSVGIDFGTFQNNKFGVKGTINVFGWRGGVFVGFDGTVKFGKLKDYQLIGSQQVREARAADATLQQGSKPQGTMNPDIHFAPNGDTLVNVTIPVLAGENAPSAAQQRAALSPLFPAEVISTVNVLSSDVVFALAQPPGGKLAFTLIDPSGITYTPDDLPFTAEYAQAVSGEDIQSMYFVENAPAGAWKVQITGDTDDTDFTLAVLGNTPPPAAVAIIQSNSPTTATLTWIAQAAPISGTTPTASLYAYAGPLTRTLTYTDSMGVLITETQDIFEGVRVAEGLTTTNDSTAYSRTIDFKGLPSGVYAFWLEVDDGENPRLRQYIRTNVVTGPVVTLTVNHSATFPTSWTATITPTLSGIKTGDMQVAWHAIAHSDALSYTLRVVTPHPLTPTLQAVRYLTTTDVAYGSVETTTVDNILPGQPYTLTLAAHNQKDGRVAWSQSVTLVTPQPDFIIVPSAPITVPSGSAVNAALTLLIPADLPFPVVLSPGYIAAPEGFTLNFSPRVITQSGTVTATLQVVSVRGMYTGTYAVPVIGQSHALVRGVVLEVNVTEPKYELYLPSVRR